MLRLLLAAFIDGGTGNIARWMSGIRFNPLHQAIPFDTLTTNSPGTFIIDMGLAWFNHMTNIDPMQKALTTTGFCGELTASSTFSVEVVSLLQGGRFGWAMVSVLVNLLGSFAMTTLAFWLIPVSPAH